MVPHKYGAGAHFVDNKVFILCNVWGVKYTLTLKGTIRRWGFLAVLPDIFQFRLDLFEDSFTFHSLSVDRGLQEALCRMGNIVEASLLGRSELYEMNVWGGPNHTIIVHYCVR